MQKKNVVARALVLLAVLISVSLFMRGLVGADAPYSVTLQSGDGQTSYYLGEEIPFSGVVEFLQADLSTTAQVTLVIGGPLDVTQILAVSAGTYSYPDNNLEVTVTAETITASSSTLPGSTIPAGTFCDCVRLTYEIEWSPPILVDPAPVFTLIPSVTELFTIQVVTPTPLPGVEGLEDLPTTVEQFPIPLVGTPEAGAPSALPDVDTAFLIPTVATPEADADAPADLPTITSAFNVPVAVTPTVEAGAPADLPTITSAFNVPVAVTPTAESGAPADLPTITSAFNVPVAATPTAESGAATAFPTLTEVFSIPTAPTPTAVAGVAELGGSPQTTEMFDIPNGKNPLGMATDGTNFYILVNGTPDQIYKVNATGTLDATFDSDGIADVTYNTDTKDKAQAIAYMGGNLYVAEESWREDGLGNSILKFSATTGAEVAIKTDPNDNSCAIPNQDRYSGLHSDGSRLWGIVDYGGRLVKITKDCTEVTSMWVPWQYSSAHGLAVGSGDFEFFFVSEGETITKRLKDDAQDTDVSWTITDFIIKGLTYEGGLLYLADADSKKVYKATIPHGQTVTTNPLGIAYDGQYLFILVDASPKDKIIVVDPNDTSTPPAIVRSFSAPGSKSAAMTYSLGFLYVAQESDSCCDREIIKIDPVSGNVAATLTIDNPIYGPLGGLGFDGTDLVGFRKSDDQHFYTISKTNGDAERVQVNWEDGSSGYHAGTFRDSTDRAYGALNNVIYEFTDEGGEQRQVITLSPDTTDIEGMTWVGPNLWIADDATDKIYKGSLGHGITITTDPLALAANGTTTLYILVDGTPFDVILEVSITSTALTTQFDAPDNAGKGLTYLGGSLYYASNDSNKIFELNPSTGATLSSASPQYSWGQINDNLLGLGNDGSDLILSTARDDFWNQCLEVIDSGDGQNQGQLCAGDASLAQAEGVAVAPDGFTLIAQDDEIVQIDPEGKEAKRWSNLDSLDIQGLAFAGNTLYIANASGGTDTIVKATVPSGISITTNPLALAANGTTTLYILVDGTPNDVILTVSITSTALTTQFDAPDDKGEGLTYLGGSLYYASNKDSARKIYVLNPSTGVQISSFQPQDDMGWNLWRNMLGLANDGTDLIITINDENNNRLEKVNISGENEGSLSPDWEDGLEQATGAAVSPDGFVLIAKDDDIVQLDPEGNEANRWESLVSVSDIQGLVFVGNTLYMADDSSGTDTIVKAAVPTGISITTDPLALAANGTTTLYILVDGSPNDVILTVSITSTLLTTQFDAPDDKGEGLTYLDGSLYYVSHKDGNQKVYVLNPSTGAQTSSFQPQDQQGYDMWENILGLAYDGTDLIITNNNQWDTCFDKIGTSGDHEDRLCPNWEDGLIQATGAAFAPDIQGREFILLAKDDEILQLDTEGRAVERWDNLVGVSDIQGLVVVGNTLYIADDSNGTDTIVKAAIPSGISVTTEPLGLAANGTTTLYILVAATPVDKILTVSVTSTLLTNSFDAPDGEGAGLTYQDGSLYYFGQGESGGAKIYELNPSTGALLGSIMPSYQWGGEIWDTPRSLTYADGNLFLYTGNQSCVNRIDPSNGDSEGELCPNYWPAIEGARGLAASSDGTLFAAKNGKVTQSVIDDQQSYEVGRWAPASLSDVQGMAFVGEVLYLADDNDDTIYKTSKPSGITTDPQGLAYDGTALYILVDGGRDDHIIVVNPATGAVVRDFAAPHRNSVGITHMNTMTTSTLFITVYEEPFDCDWCGRTKYLYRISPTDGSELAPREQIHQEEWLNGWYGLTNDDDSLILIPEQGQGDFVIRLNPDTLFYEEHIYFYNGGTNGGSAIAFHQTLGNMLVTSGSSVGQIAEDGRFLQDFNTSLSMLEGAVVIGNALFLAEAQGNTIQAAAIPSPPTQSSASPKGMATDGTNLYVVVDGSPKDRILVLGTDGTLLDFFDAPGDNTNGLTWHDGQLYAVTNEYHPHYGQQPATITVMSSLGVVARQFSIQDPWGGQLYDTITGLASDGTYLYANRVDAPQWFVIDPANPNASPNRKDGYGDFQWTHYVGSLAIATAEGIPTTMLSGGQSDNGTVITRYDLDGMAEEQFNIPLDSIEGMAYIGTNLYLADYDGRVYSTTLINNIPETTNVGDYSAVIRVASDSTTGDSNPVLAFSIVRNIDVRAQITTPLEGFATTTVVIPIQGRINDPSIDTVTVGVRLPDTLLLSDYVDDNDLEYSESLWDSQGLWHIDCGMFPDDPLHTSLPCWWRFGEEGKDEFGRGQRTEGSLTSFIIEVGGGTRLEFNSWYETEPVPEADLKLVEVSEISYDDAGESVEGPWRALTQIVGFGFGGAPVPFDKFTGDPLFDPHESFFHREMEQAAIEFGGDSGPRARFERTNVSLGAFRGLDIKIRFRFDTVNEYANGNKGWFVDDVEIMGAGFKGQTTGVTPLDPPLVDAGGVKWYSTFSSTVTLGEGGNDVIAFGRQPYSPKPSGPNLVGGQLVFGYLDLTGPTIDLGGIDGVVATPSQELEGWIDDINLSIMEVEQTFSTGVTTTDSKSLYIISELPHDGGFSIPVYLLEGMNTFTATGVDGSGNQSVTTFEVFLDTEGPTLTPLDATYPVGFTSARAGDIVIFRVDATDNLGVERVEIRFGEGEVEGFAPPGSIPQAVLSQWQASSGDWVFPSQVPPNAVPGIFDIQVVAIDFAGNETLATVEASVVATLEGFSFNLLPGFNLISLPLKPDDLFTDANGYNMVNLLGAEVLGKIDTIMYYDASLTELAPGDRWLMYSPDAPEASDTFNFETGQGYWVNMKDEVFEFDDPLAPGLPPTPRPVVWSYTGRFIDPGTLPPSYAMAPGWNLIGFHSENVLPVTTALQSLESPDRIWASLYQFNNLIAFEFGDEEDSGETQIILGSFERELPAGEMVPGKGYWLYMVEAGVLVP